LVPKNAVAVVVGVGVVEVVPALTHGDKGGDDVVAGGMSVVKRLLSQPVSERVDAKGGVVHKAETQDASIEEAACPVAPSITGHKGGEEEAHNHKHQEVVAVLPHDHFVTVQVGDVGAAKALWVLLENHPAQVCVHEALVDGVGVLLSICESVVGAMVAGPPSDGALDRAATDGGQHDLQGEGGRVGSVGPQPVIASSDAEASHEVIDNSPQHGLALHGGEDGASEAEQGNEDEEGDVQPVEVLWPIAQGDGLFCDVLLHLALLLGGFGLGRCHGGDGHECRDGKGRDEAYISWGLGTSPTRNQEPGTARHRWID